MGWASRPVTVTLLRLGIGGGIADAEKDGGQCSFARLLYKRNESETEKIYEA
jgi:hypothetical protein